MPGRSWNQHDTGPWAQSDPGQWAHSDPGHFNQSTSMQMPGQAKPDLSLLEGGSKVKGKNRNKIPKQEVPLAPPPGLEGLVEATLAPEKPVGLVPGSLPLVRVDTVEVTSLPDTVEVTGLPNRLLSHDMLEAVLEQAGVLHAVVNFDCFVGKQCGRARIYFNKGNDAAMEACVSHFHGCMWNASTQVSARVTCSRDSCAKGTSMHNRAMPKCSLREKAMPSSNFMQEYPPAFPEHMAASTLKGLKFVEDTPCASALKELKFVDDIPRFNSNELAYVGPAYVHSCLLSGATGPMNHMEDVEKASRRGAAPKNGLATMTERSAPGTLVDRHRGTSSDASTAVSDSETEREEKA